MNLIFSYILTLIYILSLLACKKDTLNIENIELDLLINGDNSRPVILSNAIVNIDTSICHSFFIGENIKILTNSKSKSLVLLFNDKIIGSNQGKIVLNKLGHNIICLKDTSSMAQISKCIYAISPTKPKERFDCSKVFFTNSRFDGTISGLPDGQYKIQVIENQYPRSYILNSSKGQGYFTLNTKYEVRPIIELKKLEKTNPPFIKCLF